jgi:soluble lytic murein transglycosylase
MAAASEATGPESDNPESDSSEFVDPGSADPRSAAARIATTASNTPVSMANEHNKPLDAADRKYFQRFFRDIDAKRFRKACSKAPALVNTLASQLVTWVCLQENIGSIPFETYKSFAATHSHWPWISKILRNAEGSLSDNTPDADILAWFDNYSPVTGRGALVYAGALQRAERHDDLAQTVATSWIELDFNRSEANTFHTRFNALITAEMEQDRLEHLLWAHRYPAAERQARRVSSDQRKLALARIALGRKRSGVDTAIGRVPAALKDNAGLRYERTRWRLRRGDHDGVTELLDQAGAGEPRPELWWPLRQATARTALSRGDIELAYRISSQHGMSSGVGFAEGEWMAGWISLRFLKQPRRGYEHFARLFYGVESPISKSRGAYWAGEAARTMGNDDWSDRWYKTAVGFRTTFYGQLAAFRLGRQISLPNDAHLPPDKAQREAFNRLDLVQAVKLLGTAGETRFQDAFLSRLRLDAETAADFKLAVELARQQKRIGMALSIAKTAQRIGITMLDDLYPSIQVVEAEPETALTLALIRQESAFDEQAISRAGARGLMQLMPATAKEVARSQRQAYDKHRLNSDPQYNMHLGQAYLAKIMNRFDGSYILALAAYNAGPHRASSWIREFGDPRDPGVDPIDWIEQIPYNETRNYVQRILESLSVYRLMQADGRSTPSTTPMSGANPFASWGHNAAAPCCY